MKAKYLSKEERGVPESTPTPRLNDPFISPEVVRGIIVGIILLIVMVHIGFSKTYIQFFPVFTGFTAAQHFHGMMMMGWLLMLLVQPILILKRKTKLHRRVGTLSYVLAPMVLLSMYLVIQSRYDVYLERGGQTKAVIAWLSLNFRLMVLLHVGQNVQFIVEKYLYKPNEFLKRSPALGKLLAMNPVRLRCI